MNARVIPRLLTLFLGSCLLICPSRSAEPTVLKQRPIDLVGTISDFRHCHSSPEELEVRIKSKKCLVDVWGLVTTVRNHQLWSQEVVCEPSLSLGTLLDNLRIDPKELSGSQLRVFRKNEIVQVPRLYRERSAEVLARLRATVLEPGDIVLFPMVQ